MKNFAICAICRKYFTDPRILSCSDRFCLKCIKSCVRSGTFSCPSHQTTSVTESEIDSLPNDRIAQDVAQFLAVKLQDFREIQCDNCSSQSCQFWCDKCESYLCETCSTTVHSIRINKSHRIVSPEEKLMPIQCSEHSEKLRFWCKTCDRLICRDCLICKHREHTCTDLQEIGEQTRSSMELSLQLIRDDLNEAATNLNFVIEKEEKHCQTVQTEIDRTFQQIQNALEQRRKQLINESNKYRTRQMKILEKYQQEINAQLETMTSRTFLVEQILRSGSFIEILQMKNVLIDLDQQIEGQLTKLNEGSSFDVAHFQSDSDLLSQVTQYGQMKSEKKTININTLSAETKTS